MGHVLGGQIGQDDFIFAHCKGSAQEIMIKKSKDSLGLTMTDNGADYNFIKRIRENSVASNIPSIEVKYLYIHITRKSILQNFQIGDYIEKINGESLAGYRHYEVAEMLNKIPDDTTFTICLVKPQKAAYIEENR